MGLFDGFKDKPTDLEVLLSEVEISGEVVKPFTLKQAEDFIPKFENIQKQLKEAGITGKNAKKKQLQMVQIVMPHAKKLLAEILNKDIPSVDAMPIGKVALIILTVFRQNSDLLKNLVPLAMEILSFKDLVNKSSS